MVYWGLGPRFWVFGLMVWGLGLRGSGFLGLQDAGFRVRGLWGGRGGGGGVVGGFGLEGF